MEMGRDWTGDDTATLIRLWQSSSAAQIGNKLHRSRYSIIGKAMRLRQEGLLPPLVNKQYEVIPWKERQPGAARPKPLPPPTPMVKAPPPKIYNGKPPPLACQPCSLIELNDDQCHWPLGEINEIATLFCGGIALEGLPYCAHHCRQAYHHPDKRKLQ